MPPGKVVMNQPLATLATSLPRLAPAQIRHSQGGHVTSAAQRQEEACFAGPRAIEIEPVFRESLHARTQPADCSRPEVIAVQQAAAH